MSRGEEPVLKHYRSLKNKVSKMPFTENVNQIGQNQVAIVKEKIIK